MSLYIEYIPKEQVNFNRFPAILTVDRLSKH
jgi:hypothetical protein